MGFGRGKGFSPVVPPVVEPEPGLQTNDCQLDHDSDDGSCQHWVARSQTFTPDHTYIAVGLSLLLTKRWISHKGPLIVKLELDELPCYEATVLWSEELHSNDLPIRGDHRWTHFVIPPLTLIKGTTYRITVHTLPGWYNWTAGGWVPGEAQAGISWRCKGVTNPYPRGSAYSGCNYRDGTGVWAIVSDVDQAFCIQRVAFPDLQVIDAGPGAGSDDCYTYGATMRLDLDYLYLDYTTLDMHLYARFLPVAIPPGATIVSAHIDLCAHIFSGAVSSLRILGIKELNTNTFSTQADADGRPVTTEVVDWAAAPWTIGSWYGGSNDAQNIKAIIQEIIDQPGWASGNALAIKIINTARTLNRIAYSLEGGLSPHLHVEYTE